jgi:YgiT-type zinc finger domain-containing protein
MSDKQEHLVEKRVTYTLQINGKLFVIENVPARVNEETGEQFFSPATVECIQNIILNGQSPDHIVEVPVYTFAA